MDKWMQRLHIEAKDGWINDPNGLVYFNGRYHVFYQHSPGTPNGEATRCQSHAAGESLTEMEYLGVAIRPDSKDDKDGVYSGCAIAHDGKMYIFYTGNVKEKGDYDYILSGRGANVIRIVSEDGVTFGEKVTVLKNSDYPDFCSCHVRDPKVWKDGDIFKMVLGARTKEDKGCVLVYHSKDLENWNYMACVTAEDFGYMWECPDYFEIEEKGYLSVSPQGLPTYDTRYQNLFQSGYFKVNGDIEQGNLAEFTEWDYGFDFYAPQSFEAPDGRRILFGWMGMGDDRYMNLTIALGRQHCLTLPREITVGDSGELLQNPIRELYDRCSEGGISISEGEYANLPLPFMLYSKTESFELILDNKLFLSYGDGMFTMRFNDRLYGAGRETRRVITGGLRDVRIIADMSSIEVFLNGGEKVMSTRFYPDDGDVLIKLVKGNPAEIKAIGGFFKSFGEQDE